MAVSRAILHEEVESRYLAYALSTIVSRALPDVRDGLKPVQRRIIYAMDSIGARDAARHVKSARVVGEVIGKYHPHGDAAVYDAMVRMAQDFSLRYPLVDGQGNFGSVDGDGAAAMRYTEAKLSALAAELLADLRAATVEFGQNYDGTLTEPAVLPARIPNLLVNGSSGIAVGMATNIPPHNLSEVCDALIHLIDNDDASTADIMQHIKGPDFPTGGEIVATAAELVEIYRRGKGGIKVRGTVEVEHLKRGRKQLVVTSLPYSVNKARLVEKIAGLILGRQLPLVADVRDESAEQTRIVLELKNGSADPEKIIAYLYKHTELEINYPVNFTCLTPVAVPERLSIKEILNHFLDFRKEVVTRRLEFEAVNLEKRLHLLRGFTVIFVDLDAAIAIIRVARDRAEAHRNLIARFDLDDEQTRAILDLRLHALVRLEIGKIQEEYEQKRARLRQIRAILAKPALIWQEVRKEILSIKKTYGDRRRTKVVATTPRYAYAKQDFEIHEDVFIVVTRNGWLKRLKSYDPRTQLLKEGDEILAVIPVHTSQCVAFFSNFGQVYICRAYDLQVSGKGYGDPIQTVFGFQDQERVVAALAATTPEPQAAPEGSAEAAACQAGAQLDLLGDSRAQLAPQQPQPSASPFCAVVTRQGYGFCFKRELLRETTTRNGRTFIKLRPGDEVLSVLAATGHLLVLATSRRLLLTPLEQVKVLAGVGQGVRLATPEPPPLLHCLLARSEDRLLLTPKKGKGRILSVSELPVYNRGAKGIVIRGGIAALQLLEDSGEAVAASDAPPPPSSGNTGSDSS